MEAAQSVEQAHLCAVPVLTIYTHIHPKRRHYPEGGGRFLGIQCRFLGMHYFGQEEFTEFMDSVSVAVLQTYLFVSTIIIETVLICLRRKEYIISFNILNISITCMGRVTGVLE